ncbi:MAG: hypothetical protein ABI896_08375 [Actinomycetota bacterium]
MSVPGAEVGLPCNSSELDKRSEITHSELEGDMRIEVNPEAREELLEFLRRADCEARADGDGAVIVEVPDAGEDQARLEVDLYLKAWQASHPDVEAHLLEFPRSRVEGEAEISD